MKRFIALILSLVMALSLCAPAWAEVASPTDVDVKVDTEAELRDALATGGEILVMDNITVDADTAINVTGTAVLNLNGKTIAGVSDQTGANRSLIIVKGAGDLTVKNGSVTMEHKGANMGWNNSTNALEAVSGGTLTLDHVTVTNLGGSDMAYAVNIANNGGATLKTIASTLESKNYVALRIFNNADGDINVDLTEGSVLTGKSSPFFVHFWTKTDLGDKQAARQKYLTVSFNDTEVSRYSGSKSLVRFGFDDEIYFSGTDMAEVVAGTEAALKWALENGKNVLLNNDLTVAATLNVTKDTVINGNNKTLTYTGDNRAIDVAKETNGANLTINDLTIAFPAGYRQRGINYNTNGTLTLNNVTVGSEAAYPTYAVNFPGSANGAKAVIDKCDLYGCIALNVWGKDMEIGVTGSDLTTVDNSDVEGYAVVKLNNDGVTAAEGTVINISDGSINITGSGAAVKPSKEFINGTSTGVININNPPGGSVAVSVAVIRYPDYNVSYSFYSVQDAITFAVETDKATKENPVQVEVLKTAATNGGSYTHAEGVKLVLPEGCAEFKDGDKYTVKAVVAKIGDVPYASLQDAVTAVKNGETIAVVVAGESAVVSAAKTFTVTGKAATITAADGYKLTGPDANGKYVVEKLYTVKFDANGGSGTMKDIVIVAGGEYQLPNCTFNAPEGKQFKGWGATANATELLKTPYVVNANATLYAIWENVPVEKVEDTEVMVQVAPPEVTVSDKITGEEAEIAKEVEVFEICTDAMTKVVEEMAEQKVPVKDEQVAELDELFTEKVTEDDVVVVIQTKFEVEVKDVVVDDDGAATVTLDITPVYQKVITTKDVVENNETIELDKNAVAIPGASGELNLKGEKVDITIAIPEALAKLAVDKDGEKVLYVTHTKDNKAKDSFIYVAEVKGNDAAGYTATFTNPNGFSSFNVSNKDNTAVRVSRMNYANLQSAINNIGKGAVVEVLKSDEKATVEGSNFSFTVKLASGVTKPAITPANGYRVVEKELPDGSIQYNVYRVGGYGGGTTTSDKTVTSPSTFDAGIGLYVGMSVLSAMGGAVVLKKRED